MQYSLMFCYCLLLVGIQVVTGLGLLNGYTGGHCAINTVFLFFGINLPTILAGMGQSRDQQSQVFKNPAGCLVMTLIMTNFMRAGAMSGDWANWFGILHILSAQSLWIAVPTWMAERQRYS